MGDLNLPYELQKLLVYHLLFYSIFGNRGIISMDYEYLNYGGTRFYSSVSSFEEINTVIKEKYKNTSNIKLGGELKLNDFSIRAGHGIYGNPFVNKMFNTSLKNYSFGLGLTKNNFFADLSFVFTRYSKQYFFYAPSPNIAINPVKNDIQNASITATLGFRFKSNECDKTTTYENKRPLLYDEKPERLKKGKKDHKKKSDAPVNSGIRGNRKPSPNIKKTDH